MKKFLSPTKFKNFLNCKYIIYNEAFKDDLNIKKKEKSKTDLLRFEKGNQHEDNYFNELKKKYKNFIDLKKGKDFKIRFEQTILAMEEGYEVIRSGVLKNNDWYGETDFLIKVNSKSKFGNYSYIVHETKNSNQSKVDHVIQAGIYCSILENIQKKSPETFSIILKDFQVEEIRYDKIKNYVTYNQKKYERFLEKDLEDAKPEKCQHCNICDWIEVCEKVWIDEDNLNQICNINKSQIKKLNDSGIKKIDELSKRNIESKIKNLNPEVYKRLNLSAKLRKKFQKNNKPQWELIEENLAIEKGFNLLPKPEEGDLFFDIESVQDHVYPAGLEYLFGIYYIENNQEQFKAFWAHSFEEEKNNLKNFFDFTEAHFQKYPNGKIYHYASYEITALRKLVAKHNICGAVYDKYLRIHKFVDLFALIKNAILTSENSYSIKNLEKFYDFKRSGDIQKGDVSEDYYAEWIETGDKGLLEEIEFYNKQDCHSTYELRNWLLKIRPENCSWYFPKIKEDDLEKKPYEIKQEEYSALIKSKKFKLKDHHEQSDHILGYFRRDQRPEYRLFFERKQKTHEELIDDTECIGNMKMIDKPYPQERSFVYTYEFPDQEYKIKEGDRTKNANHILLGEKEYAGTVIELNQEKRIVKLKKMRRKDEEDLPQTLSIGREQPPGIADLEAATYRYFDSLISNSGTRYTAIDDIICKNSPRLTGIKKGENIIKSDNFHKEIPEAIQKLDNSYLFIQGPPGTGKTTQASNAIVELIKKNKKIGVVANSHRVINNLIKKVEDLALQNNVEFAGIKRGSQKNEDSHFNGKLISTYYKDDLLIPSLKKGSHKLFAGTKYHFAKGFYDQQLDYIFVDEAGQLTTADIVVIGTAAKNIILIGDQMQLPQPSSADHPGDSGKSVLEYLLENNDTVSNDKGIFLNKTFRMHPNINKFISNSFYEGRLNYDDQTSKREIHFKSKINLISNGINFIEADHKNFSQRNEIEGEIVKKLYKDLIGSEFKDQEGNKRLITHEDILTISPYNIQVNYLKSILKDEARVGTIDKFQGQEAPITIVSMATSDSDNIPRGLDFLLNRNRLNVAVSRSQLMSVIIFSPDLLASNAKKIEDIYLIENFFKLTKFKINYELS